MTLHDVRVAHPEVADEVGAAAVEVIRMVDVLVERMREDLYQHDFAESVRFRNATMREFRAALGLDGNDRPLALDAAIQKARPRPTREKRRR